MLTEIGRSVARAGPRRLVILNSHGGQPQVVDIVCRRLRGDGMFAVNCMASRLGLPPDITLTREEQAYGIHGGLVETSLMLHLRPDLVRTDRAIDFRSAWLEHEGAMTTLTPEGGVGFGWETQDLHRLALWAAPARPPPPSAEQSWNIRPPGWQNCWTRSGGSTSRPGCSPGHDKHAAGG